MIDCIFIFISMARGILGSHGAHDIFDGLNGLAYYFSLLPLAHVVCFLLFWSQG